jgi:hypothetical protein
MLGVGVLEGFLKSQSAIARVKNPRLKAFFISLEKSLEELMLKMGSHRPFGHL